MSVTEQVKELDVDIEEVAERVARGTIPGRSNERFERGIVNTSAVVPVVIEDLNNWFEVLEVRIKDEHAVSIPMRYRWSIIRWARQDMDKWLMDHGWDEFAHRQADTHVRQENEMEARYRKRYGDVTVYCNFLVNFPPSVFKKIKEDSDQSIRKKQRERVEKKNTIDDIVEDRRKGNV